MKHAGPIVASTPLLFAIGCSFSVPPAVPVGAPVPVSFSAPSSDGSLQLQVSGPGRPEQACALPCTLQVPSGSAVLTLSGPRKLAIPAVIPPEPSQAEIRFRRNGQALGGWITALVGVAAGGIALAATRNAGLDGQLKGGIAGAVGGGVGLVGIIVALTAGKDEARLTGDPGVKAVGPGAPPPPPKALSSGAAGAENAGCKSRFDCTGGRVCREGRCAAPACVADRDCPSGQACSLEGACVSAGAAR